MSPRLHVGNLRPPTPLHNLSLPVSPPPAAISRPSHLPNTAHTFACSLVETTQQARCTAYGCLVLNTPVGIAELSQVSQSPQFASAALPLAPSCRLSSGAAAASCGSRTLSAEPPSVGVTMGGSKEGHEKMRGVDWEGTARLVCCEGVAWQCTGRH